MRLSVWPTANQPWSDLAAVAAQIDDGNWHCLYVADHFMGDGGGFGAETDPHLEVMGVLAALAGITSRVRLAPLVLSATYRQPAVVANWAATVDQISEGRLTLGLGAGWQLNEHQQYGIELGAPGERLARLEETCAVVRSLFTESRTSFVGRYVTVSDALCEPKPLQHPLPLLIGGKGDRMMRLVARQADQWNMWAGPEQFAERVAVLDAACEAIGRDPRTILRSTQALVCVTDDEARARAFVDAASPRPAFAGPAARFAELVSAWTEVGVDEVIIPDMHLGLGARRADALDALHAAARAVVP